MYVIKAVEIISKIIAGALAEYDTTEEAWAIAEDGTKTRIAHSLDGIDEADKLFYLDMAIKDVALSASPISLLETTGSVASELRRVSTTYYIRVPKEPIMGELLDIDDGLAYAVVYNALANLWRDFGEYTQKSDSVINTYIQAYREYLENLIDGVVGAGSETYIRFSADGVTWQDSFSPPDKYISFKKVDTDTWTTAIEFVGADGVAGADGADGTSSTSISSFKDLIDTPSTLTVDKFIKVNSAGDALEFVDAPTSSAGLAGANVFGDKVLFNDDASGSFALDAKDHNVFYIYPNADTELSFTMFDDEGTSVPAWWGTTYTFFLVSNGSINITFDSGQTIFGDSSVALGTSSSSTNITTTILKMFYTGYDWYIVSKTEVLDANG